MAALAGLMQRRDAMPRLRVDKLGVLLAMLAAYALAAAPFVTFRANRIVPGDGVSLWDALPLGWAVIGAIVIIAGALVALIRTPPHLRLTAGFVVLVCVFLLAGMAGGTLIPEGDKLARISPASGFWLFVLAFALLATDGLSRLALRPLLRVTLLALVLAVVVGALALGGWDKLSIMSEYRNRADSFWAEGAMHLKLAFGSMAAAVVVGVPLGLLCHRVQSARNAILTALNTIQTIPSMAMFGLMIAPLGWIAVNVPGASALGIRGIGAAPAFIALFLYSLLPVVANTVAGLAGVSLVVRDAARGMGMTWMQKLVRVELPLAFPVMLTGIRIVLVQNIGLVTIAALIGGGGYGVFVFQGIGQMAMDLVLLGAIPTVVLAFCAAIVLDALIEAAWVPTAQEDES